VPDRPPILKSAKLAPGPWAVPAEPTMVDMWHNPDPFGATSVNLETGEIHVRVWTTLAGVEALRDACNALLAEADSPVPDSDPVRALVADDARGEVDR
jgi:hypothetical protein